MYGNNRIEASATENKSNTSWSVVSFTLGSVRIKIYCISPLTIQYSPLHNFASWIAACSVNMLSRTLNPKHLKETRCLSGISQDFSWSTPVHCTSVTCIKVVHFWQSSEPIKSNLVGENFGIANAKGLSGLIFSALDRKLKLETVTAKGSKT